MPGRRPLRNCWRARPSKQEDRTMVKKRKAKKKVRVVTRDEMVKKMVASNRACSKAENELEAFRSTFMRQEDALRIERQRVQRFATRNGEQNTEVSRLQKKVNEMYVEVYDLVRCLNATREKWYDSEDKVKRLKRGQEMQAFSTKAAASDCDEGPRTEGG
ncbi:hypothetical protein LCGC14_0813590 [marine sediment metagenome]|uniref:Uncharacterized protein n=1 Tax=marine sediment metagenome TaxID=412755 RepID=A0A0F9Q646_9ZZZZ